MTPTKDYATEPICHSKACAIQDCLAKNSYDETKCHSQVEALYQCCNTFYVKHGDEAKNSSCPKASLLRLKMKQRKDKDVNR